MKLRKIDWVDLQVTVYDWTKTNGARKVHASLRGCSFINHTFWLTEWNDTPEQRLMVILAIREAASQVFRKLKPYLEDETKISAAVEAKG